MENKTINIGVVAEIAIALQELKKQMVFVGGAVVSLYADDPSADEIRPTEDVDMTVNLMNYTSWAKMQERLADLGFHPDPFGHSVCSYKYKNIPVDIMSAEDGPLGPSNRWYQLGFTDLWNIKAYEQKIQILSSSCYLATKFEAFNNRGNDFRTSHDFEDIIYVLDNRTTIVEEISETNREIQDFLRIEFKKVFSNKFSDEIISAHLHPLLLDERKPLVLDKINQIINL